MIGWRSRDVGWEGVQRRGVVAGRQSVGLCGGYAAGHIGGAGWSEVTLFSRCERINNFNRELVV